MQQARNLYNARKCDKVTQSDIDAKAICLLDVFNGPSEEGEGKAGASRRGTPALQVVGTFIGLKASVACLISSWLNPAT